MSKHQPYGNVRMKGKREKLLACGCCVAINKKKNLEVDREILESLKRHDWDAAVKKINGPSGR